MEGPARKPPSRAATALVVVGLLGGRAEAQSPSPPPPESKKDDDPAADKSPPTPALARLKLDIDRHVEERLAEEERKGTPRFETRVEVVGKSPQMMLDRYFGGVDLECTPGGAPPDGGAPTEVEMREARWHLSPYADFLALGKFIADKLNGKGAKAERYFLYRVRAGDGVSYLLREGRAPDTLLYGAPGTTFELVDAFPDLDSGTRAWRRMERGFPTPVGPTASPPAAWQATTCRAWR